MADKKFVEEVWKPAQPLLDELEPVLAKYPAPVQIGALALQLVSYSIGGRHIDPTVLCALIVDCANVRDEETVQ